MKNIKQYYKEFGKVAYAVAIADGIVTAEEKKALKESVLKHLAKYEPEQDSSNMNKAFYTEFEFEDDLVQRPDTKEVIKSYSLFIHQNFEPGDESLLKHSMEVLEAVASAYSRKNEKETVQLIKESITEISKTILN